LGVQPRLKTLEKNQRRVRGEVADGTKQSPGAKMSGAKNVSQEHRGSNHAPAKALFLPKHEALPARDKKS